eukprot:SAG31_NODE_4681_length_3035_cov_1.624659_2_plen_87_part_00
MVGGKDRLCVRLVLATAIRSAGKTLLVEESENLEVIQLGELAVAGRRRMADAGGCTCDSGACVRSAEPLASGWNGCELRLTHGLHA